MKNKIIYLITLIGVLMLVSCKKDENKALLKANADAPSLTTPSDGTTQVFTIADSAKNIEFTWTSADFGYPATITYALQIDKADNQFKKPTNIATTILRDTTTVNIYALVNTLLAMGLVENQQSTVEVRVRAIISAVNSGTFADTSFSATIKMNLTPFPVIINYPKLWVAGSYNGWADPSVPATYVISSVNSDDSYEGYLYFPDAVTTLKLLKTNAWVQDLTVGDPNASGTSGTLQIGNWGGNNISISGGPGYFKFNADLNAKTYTYKKTVWALAGDFNSWGDTPMTYNIANNVWTLTTNLTVGNIKFKLNGDASWTLNYGDNKGNGKLQSGGSNIPITAAGNYTITLDLSKAIYTYKLVKN